MPADDLALLAHRLDRRSDFHAAWASRWSTLNQCPRPGSGDRYGRRYRAEGKLAAPKERATSAPRDVSSMPAAACSGWPPDGASSRTALRATAERPRPGPPPPPPAPPRPRPGG